MTDYIETEEEFKDNLRYMNHELVIDMYWQFYRDHFCMLRQQTIANMAADQVAAQRAIENYHNHQEGSSIDDNTLELQHKIEQLQATVDELREELDRIHSNARKAGRKRTIPEIKRLMIIHDRSCGLTLRKLKAKYGHSLSTLAFICENELPNDNNNSLQ